LHSLSMTVAIPSRKQHMDQQEFFRLFDRAFAIRSRELLRRERMIRSAASRNPRAPMKPRMELFDDPESSIITAQVEVPGMKTSDVSLQIQEERLVVSGERRPTLAVGERRNGDEAPVQPATDSGTQTPVPAGNTPNTPTPHPNKFPVQELKYGKFLREICIPTGLRVNEISASMVDGMLTITWPRTSAAERARSIEVD
jgi:HSP20 family protein